MEAATSAGVRFPRVLARGISGFQGRYVFVVAGLALGSAVGCTARGSAPFRDWCDCCCDKSYTTGAGSPRTLGGVSRKSSKVITLC